MTTINLRDLELRAIDTQRSRFGWVSLAAIIVSFVHMASALVLFSNAHWYEQAAALGMTAIVDWATWVIAEYLDYARRRRMQRSGWIKVLFAFALLISMFLNGAYLWANRPPEADLPGWMSAGIAITFAAFVPMVIAVASLARGELTDDRLQQQQAAQEERNARALLTDSQAQVRSLQAELHEARALLAQHETTHAQTREQLAQVSRSSDETVRSYSDELAQARAQIDETVRSYTSELAQARAQIDETVRSAAQYERELAQQREQVTQLEAAAAQYQAARAQWARIEEELRTTIAYLESQVRDALAAGPLNPLAVAQRLIDLGETQRKAAEFVGMKESTLRSRLKAGAST